MKLKEMKSKVLSLIEEYSPESTVLTDDEDILYKMNGIINQVTMDLFKFRKPLKHKDKTITSTSNRYLDLEDEIPTIYQFKNIVGCDYEMINENLIELDKDYVGDISIYYYAYPSLCKTEFANETARIAEDNSFDIDLDSVLLEILPWGVAYNVLRLDMISSYGSYFEKTYNEMIQRIDSRKTAGYIHIEGGID